MVFFRKFESEYNVYTGEATKEKFKEFFSTLMVPTVFPFGEDEIEAIFGQQQPTVVMFRNEAKDADAKFM